jgi:hypothetical protein
MTLSFMDARLPTGIWLTSVMWGLVVENGFKEYHTFALLPHFLNNEAMSTSNAEEFVVRAKNVYAVMSQKSSEAESYGLSWANRSALAKDEDCVEALLLAMRSEKKANQEN